MMMFSYHSELPFTLELPFSPSPAFFNITQEPEPEPEPEPSSAAELLFTDHLSPIATPVPLPPSPTPKKINIPNTNGTRKRATRKDRHSKIVTAQGTRDRRMRLNLEVAPQFFDIQDMLGFDKASKTVKWLMNEAKASIDKLKKAHSKTSTNNDQVSSSELEYCDHDQDINSSTVTTDCKGKCPDIAPKVKKLSRARLPVKSTRPPQFSPSVAREIRDKARERARERTRVKFMNQQESGSHEFKSSMDVVGHEVLEEQCSPSINQQNSSAVNNRGGVDALSVSISDYNNNNTMATTNNLFQWVSQFEDIEDMIMSYKLDSGKIS